VDASPEQFDRQVAVLKEYCSLIDTADLERYREQGQPLPRNPAMLTFDDGYRDCLTVALPILKKHHAKAVFFISTGYMGERRLFWWKRICALIARCQLGDVHIDYPEPMCFSLSDEAARYRTARCLSRLCKTQQRIDLTRFLTMLADACEVRWNEKLERGLADELILDWSGVRALAEAGMDVQSHGESHRVFSTISTEELLSDLRASRTALQAQTGLPQRALSYPCGVGCTPGDPVCRTVGQAGYKLGFGFDMDTCRLGRLTDWLNIPHLSSTAGMTEGRFRGYLAFPNYLA
jgi:peptidoglycan/xylan/chitin deacetylase (PgdA/CDA1 family)